MIFFHLADVLIFAVTVIVKTGKRFFEFFCITDQTFCFVKSAVRFLHFLFRRRNSAGHCNKVESALGFPKFFRSRKLTHFIAALALGYKHAYVHHTLVKASILRISIQIIVYCQGKTAFVFYSFKRSNCAPCYLPVHSSRNIGTLKIVGIFGNSLGQNEIHSGC